MTVKETIARYGFDSLVPYLKPIIYKPRQPREFKYVTGVEGDFWRDILASEFSWDPQTTEIEALAWLLKYLSPDSEPFDTIANHPDLLCFYKNLSVDTNSTP